VVNGLAELNLCSPGDAENEFLKCCGSQDWARSMTERRPFHDLEMLLSEADKLWASLTPQDWLEAFRSHPKIGERKAEQAQTNQARAWSEQEQAGIRDAAQETMAELAAGNRAYEQKFGYIFIVCATGKTSAEMLALLRARLHNDAETELRVAAEEQRKITQLRLRKLIGSDDAAPKKP
jgi:OHCU decarboxylase